MNRKLLCLLPLTIVFSACAQLDQSGEPDCGNYDGPIPHLCLGDPQTPIVMVHTKDLTVSPYCVRAYPGRTITFHFVPKAPQKAGAVELFPKNADNTWLGKSNGPDKDHIEVVVPPKQAADDYDYGIKTVKKCVDPRVRIEVP